MARDAANVLPMTCLCFLVVGAACNGVTVEVKNGERVTDLAERLWSQRLTDKAALRWVAQSQPFPEYPWLPEPSKSLSRFEGAFVPGQYVFSSSQLEPMPSTTDTLVRRNCSRKNAEVLVTRLLEESAARFAHLETRFGLSPYQQAVLASIVEKEAVANEDYGQVAAVFHNRLLTGRRLGSCPSVEYALGYHRPFLTDSDVEIDSPYNLYRHSGLPPTPIAFFSDEALRATQSPPSTNVSFFVFDWVERKLRFAKDLEGHQANAARARANYVAHYGETSLHTVVRGKYYE